LKRRAVTGEEQPGALGETMADGRWRHREARGVRFRDRLAVSGLLGAGAISQVRLFDWWFRDAHVAQPFLFALLSMAFWYGMARLLVGWVNYAGMATPGHAPAPAGLRVAIFTTSAPGEPPAMFEKTLAACRRISYPHTTYLLDDTADPRFRDIASRHGAVWLELAGLPGAKAGKINRALELTSEEFILVLDPDHIPFPVFLDRVLGHFKAESVGLVQVSQAYYNQARSFTAAGAAEQTYAFYGPGLIGLHGHGTGLAIGANCTFRRAALASIGGHGVGLAEDLVTAIRLHAAGWESIYVPEIVSRGLVPEDLGSYYKQQLNWSRGVFEVAFAELPRLVGRLTWSQRFAYLAIGTYFLCGVTTGIFLVFPYLYLWTGVQPAATRFSEFLVRVAPVGACGLVTYLFVQRWLCHPIAERGLHWRGLALKLTCWPVYLQGTVMSVMRAELPYVPTAKLAVRGRFLALAWPQLALLALFGVTLLRTVYARLTLTPEAALQLSAEAVWGMVAFATLPALAAAVAIYAAWQSRRPAAGAPWDEVNVERLGEA
jgi:cellulose synthase (UDP-forming)